MSDPLLFPFFISSSAFGASRFPLGGFPSPTSVFHLVLLFRDSDRLALAMFCSTTSFSRGCPLLKAASLNVSSRCPSAYRLNTLSRIFLLGLPRVVVRRVLSGIGRLFSFPIGPFLLSICAFSQWLSLPSRYGSFRSTFLPLFLFLSSPSSGDEYSYIFPSPVVFYYPDRQRRKQSFPSLSFFPESLESFALYKPMKRH